MHSRLEKPIIREERAETSLVAFIEFGFPISRSNNWQTQERVFEEKGLIFYLRLKEEVWESIRTIPEPLKMTKKRTFLVWRPISKAIFQKLKPASKNPRAGNRKWIFPETMRFNLENWWTTTTILCSFKICSRSSFRKMDQSRKLKISDLVQLLNDLTGHQPNLPKKPRETWSYF